MNQASAQEALRKYFGFEAFRGIQRDVIDHVITGRDALVLMPTGSGKSLCYQIPALVRPGMGVVISPLISLIENQLSSLNQKGIRAAALHSMMTESQLNIARTRIVKQELDLLYLAPERVLTDACLALLDRAQLSVIAIDESHCISMWGHSFRPEYGELGTLAVRYPKVPRIALTATADEITRRDILERLRMPNARTFLANLDRPNIRYRITEKKVARHQLLEFIQKEHLGETGIVYCISRRGAEDTARFLTSNGIESYPYHAMLDTNTRNANQRRFLSDKPVVLVATIAFGMGIDKPNVRFVAHLDLPRNIEAYCQETGRAGRDGRPADAWMIHALDDFLAQLKFIEDSSADELYKRHAMAKLEALLALTETAGCRRVPLLDYFGQTVEPCGNCDNCLSKPSVWDATGQAMTLLSCIRDCYESTRYAFGPAHILNVLLAKRTRGVLRHAHQKLKCFGAGVGIAERHWKSIMRQLILLQWIRVDHQRYGVIELNDSSEISSRGRILIARRSPLEIDEMRAKRGSHHNRFTKAPMPL